MLTDDDSLNTADDQHFNELVAKRHSRRSVMGGGLAAAAAFLTGGSLVGRVASAGAASGRGAANGNGMSGRAVYPPGTLTSSP